MRSLTAVQRIAAPCLQFGRFAIVGVLMMGCRDLTARLPANAIDPGFYQTAEAAERMARNARYEFQLELLSFIRNSGGIADEFRWKFIGDPIGSWEKITAIDSRILPEEGVPEVDRGKWIPSFGGYQGLQRVRSIALQGRSALRKYGPESSAVFQGEVTVYEGFAVVMLADLFCSGVPLTTVDFEGDITYQPGSTTRELYAHAVALFDTALQLSTTDSRITMLARVGKARALLALGEYSEAAKMVDEVPTGFSFALPILRGNSSTSNRPLGFDWNLEWNGGPATQASVYTTHISDQEGNNGLPYLSSRDPRIRKDSFTSASLRVNRNGVPNRFPALRTDLIVANDIEARLIEAEAALRSNRPEWLTILNALRTNGSYTVVPGNDTVWNPGTGGVARLAPLRDPADTAEPGVDVTVLRIDLLFYERAFWLFASGHRQGDLRRLIRNDRRTVATVYPYGAYRGGAGYYGDYVDVPLPYDERINPYASGCMERGA